MKLLENESVEADMQVNEEFYSSTMKIVDMRK